MRFLTSENEERYFAIENFERRQRIRQRAEKAAHEMRAREKIGEAVGTSDHELAKKIGELGFEGETAHVFNLLPLILVAWSDGKIQRGERALLLQLLEERGIQKGSEAFLYVESLLEERPSDDFFEASLELLREIRGQQGGGKDVVDMCLLIAEASGGLLGFGDPVSDSERAAIGLVADRLGSDARAAFRKRMVTLRV